jgi:hypothetical protein
VLRRGMFFLKGQCGMIYGVASTSSAGF